MSRRTQLSILITVLVIFFCCCSGAGLVGRTADGLLRLKLDLQGPSAAWLRGLLNERLRGSQLELRAGAEAGCAIQGERLLIPQGASCTFALPASTRRTRQLVVILPTNGSGGGALNYDRKQVLDDGNTVSAADTIKRGDEPLVMDVYVSQKKSAAALLLTGCTVGKDAPAPPEGQLPVCVVEIQR